MIKPITLAAGAAALFIPCIGAAADNSIAGYTVESSTAYPGSFYGRVFTARNGGRKSYVFDLLDQNYGASSKQLNRDLSILLGCRSMTITIANQDTDYYDGSTVFESESARSVEFSDCVTADGSYSGKVFTGEGQPRVTVFENSVPEQLRESLTEYREGYPQELLELSACAQDCPSEEFPQINAVTSYTAQGYTLYPTIIYPLTYEDRNGWIGMSYIAKTYIKPGKPEHFGYMIYDAQQISPENAEMHLKKFCGEKVEIRKSGDGSEFENCMSVQRKPEVKIKGKISRSGSLNILTFWYDGMKDQELTMFNREVKQRVDNFNPADFRSTGE